MSKSNKYGYSGVDIPTQAFQANVGKFDPAEINELVADNKWTQYGQLELIETQTASAVAQQLSGEAGGFVNTVQQACDGLIFYMDLGTDNFTGGTFTLYKVT